MKVWQIVYASGVAKLAPLVHVDHCGANSIVVDCGSDAKNAWNWTAQYSYLYPQINKVLYIPAVNSGVTYTAHTSVPKTWSEVLPIKDNSML